MNKVEYKIKSDIPGRILGEIFFNFELSRHYGSLSIAVAEFCTILHQDYDEMNLYIAEKLHEISMRQIEELKISANIKLDEAKGIYEKAKEDGCVRNELNSIPKMNSMINFLIGEKNDTTC
jgi:hypothetical protein